MRSRVAELVLWSLAALFAATALVRWHRAVPAVASTHAVPASLPWPAAPAPTIVADARAVAAADPFRLDRRPADVPFATVPEEAAPPAQTVPSFRLGGIIGPPWEALVDGVPGRSGSVVVTLGTAIGDFIVQRIGPDSVVLARPDTVVILVRRGGSR